MKKIIAITSVVATAVITSFALREAPTARTKLKYEHERLRFINEFKTPEDVVKYFVNRDASGFIWSGMLDPERLAFTMWDTIPKKDTFFIAKEFTLSAPRVRDVEVMVCKNDQMKKLERTPETQRECAVELPSGEVDDGIAKLTTYKGVDIDVTYTLTGIGDASGTWMPPDGKNDGTLTR